jgi:hypothetical protein
MSGTLTLLRRLVSIATVSSPISFTRLLPNSHPLCRSLQQLSRTLIPSLRYSPCLTYPLQVHRRLQARHASAEPRELGPAARCVRPQHDRAHRAPPPGRSLLMCVCRPPWHARQARGARHHGHDHRRGLPVRITVSPAVPLSSVSFGLLMGVAFALCVEQCLPGRGARRTRRSSSTRCLTSRLGTRSKPGPCSFEIWGHLDKYTGCGEQPKKNTKKRT